MSKLHEQMKDYINWVVGSTFLLVSILLSKDQIKNLFHTDPVRGALSVGLMVLTCSLFFLYIRAVRCELDLIDSAFDSDKIRNVTGMVLPVGIGLSALFAALIAYSTNIMVYSGIATIYSSFDLYGQNNVIRNVNIFIKEGLFKSPNGKEESDVLFDYYIKKPLLSKIAITLVSFCAAFVLSVVGRLKAMKELEYVAYCVVIITIIIGEVLIQTWRRSRDKSLSSVKNKVHQSVAIHKDK